MSEYLTRLLTKRFHLDFRTSLAVIAFATAFVLLAAFYVQPGPFIGTLKILNESGAWIYIMNWLPILFCAGIVYFVFNSCALAVSVTGSVFGILSVANYLKIKMRQSPLFPWDLSLGGEVIGIARSFPETLISTILLMLAGMLIFIVLSAVFVRNKPLDVRTRVIGLFSLILSAVLLSGYYTENDLYDNAYIDGNPYSEVNKFNSRGFVYSFVHVLANTKIERPPGYDKQAATDFLAEREKDITQLMFGEKPHVIVIMSEAFSDMPLSPGLDFSGYPDPIANYKELKNRSPGGYVVTPNFGGGTADTEFDVLTGINTRNYRGVPYTFKLVNKRIASLATVLARIGYESVVIHPGFAWFYDRVNAYSFLGFDRLIFLPEFGSATNIGGYVSEADTIDKVISEFETHITGSSAPLFTFCITIQNHGPYLDKYTATKSSPTDKNFESSLPLSDLQYNALYNYFYGLAAADRELGRLTEYFKERSEPVVMLFFGDHLPSFDYDVYDAVLPPGEPGKVSGETRLFRAPYFIWHNAAADKLVAPERIPADETISTQYLGAVLLEALNFQGLCPYFDYVAQTAKEYPVVLESRYADISGTVHEADEPETLKMLRKLEYYRFFTTEQ